MAPHGEKPLEDNYTDLWGGHWRRGGRYVCRVIPMIPDIGDKPVVGVPRKGAQNRQAPLTIHVKAL